MFPLLDLDLSAFCLPPGPILKCGLLVPALPGFFSRQSVHPLRHNFPFLATHEEPPPPG